MEKFSLVSFGCKINQYESHQLIEKFISMGLQKTDEIEEADLCLVNTCSVTARADQKARKFLRKIHNQNPRAILIVTGCYGTTGPDRDELLELPGVAYVVPNHQKMEIPALYANHTGKTYDHHQDFLTPLSGNRTRVYLKIQDGCNLMCTYCKIPYVRNHLTSKAPEVVVAEAERYVRRGYREIVITGVHLGLYGWKKSNAQAYSLPALLWKLSKIRGLERLRISSLEANEISSELLDVLSASPNICPHLHLPLQSGDDRILKLMNRKYTSSEFLEKIDLIQSHLDRPGLTTDVIYGFPTETEEEFEHTLEVVKKAGFHRVHGFPFSPRRRTPAYRLTPRTSPKEMQRRKEQLLHISQKASQKYRRAFLGEKVNLLVEAHSDHPWGYSRRYLKCSLLGEGDWDNHILEGEVMDLSEDGVMVQVGSGK